jgi:ubiquinone/menaquinone biosynthesis C-methylase UbiE
MANVGPDDFLIDLGSGDGRIPITAAKKFGIRAMGVDLNPARIAESNANAKEAGVNDKVEFKQGDLFQQDISKATVLTMYLLPDVNMKLRPKILKDLKPGTRVVSHAFSMGDWTPEATTTSPDGRNTVYMWIVPDPKVGPKGVKK